MIKANNPYQKKLTNEGISVHELALFAGAGGGILAGQIMGWTTVCAVERDAYAAQVLAQRQTDGILPPFPIWSDVQHFDGRPWRGIVDVVSGGFPCQDISIAGLGSGINGKRSSLWGEMARIIGEVRPRYAFIENSPMLAVRGLDAVLSDLAAIGYDAEWMCHSAEAVGATHVRERIWILAYANRPRELQQTRMFETLRRRFVDGGSALADTDGTHGQGDKLPIRAQTTFSGPTRNNWWATEPAVGRMAHGVANRVDRIKALGNGQVPSVAFHAFHELQRRIHQQPVRQERT